MSQNVPNVHTPFDNVPIPAEFLIVNGCNQTILVPADVEHDAFAREICASKRLPYRGEVDPCAFPDRFVPSSERRFGLRMVVPECLESFDSDDAHGPTQRIETALPARSYYSQNQNEARRGHFEKVRVAVDLEEESFAADQR
jgi:hypothetical protein